MSADGGRGGGIGIGSSWGLTAAERTLEPGEMGGEQHTARPRKIFALPSAEPFADRQDVCSSGRYRLSKDMFPVAELAEAEFTTEFEESSIIVVVGLSGHSYNR